MRLLMIDIDTLRPDHLGCYGYSRATSPAIDAIAAEGYRFDGYYCSDAPCLPSRAALFTGKFGIHNGVVDHGGTAADPRYEGASRDFRDLNAITNLPAVMRMYGMHTATVSTFAERHSAWWFYAGFNEAYNIGTGGSEIAQEVADVATDWLDRNRDRKDWFLHVHFWDPHTEYRTPLALGNPFDGQSSEAIDWIDEATLAKHRAETGFHAASNVSGFSDSVNPEHPRQLGKIETLQDVRKNVDGYDCGVWNADRGVAAIVEKLKALDLYRDTAILVTADHGECLGELGRYDEHGCADYATTHIPLIIRWPGLPGGRAVPGLHYNVDLLPTLIGLMGNFTHIPFHRELEALLGADYLSIYTGMIAAGYDGHSFADALRSPESDRGEDALVVSLCTHAVQRAVRFADYLYIRTYHDGYCQFPDEMLFDVKSDPHETHDLSASHPELVHKAAYLLEKWVAAQMKKTAAKCPVDPLWVVLGEGGGYHVRGKLSAYLQHLEAVGRTETAEQLRKRYGEK